MSGGEIREVTVGIAGSHIRSLESDGVTAVANPDEITYADINRAIEAARALKVPLDNEILHVIPKDFKIDGQSGIKDPTNMSGVRLEVKVHIITGAVNSAHNIVKTVNKADLHVDNIVLNPLASSVSVLSEEEQNLGVILIDLGAGTADIAAYVNSNIIHTSKKSMVWL
jgi:cell division protein FtsA